MADVGVEFTVVADTREAKGELSDLEKALLRLQTASGRGGGGGGGNPPRPGGDGEEFGKAAGKQIGKALAGFMAREASGIIFAEMRRRGMGGDSLDIWQGALGGALAFGTTGAMLGGPWGALIGGGLGAAAGGIKAWQEKEENRQKLIDELEDQPRQTNMSLSTWAESEAISRHIRLTPKAQRYDLISRYQNTAATEADSLRKLMEESILGGMDQESAQYKELAGRYQAKQGMVNALNRSALSALMDDSGVFTPPQIARDAFAKQGLYVGAQVPAGAGTEGIARDLKKAVDILSAILGEAKKPFGGGIKPIATAVINAKYGN